VHIPFQPIVARATHHLVITLRFVSSGNKPLPSRS
jgi:hypothetical protein